MAREAIQPPARGQPGCAGNRIPGRTFLRGVRTPLRPSAWAWRALPLLVVIVVAVVAGCGSSAPAGVSNNGAAVAHTRQVYVAPVTSAGRPVAAYSVTSRASDAYCEAGSEAIGEGYRCSAGNYLYDPCCPVKAAKPTVLCLAQPWLHTVAELRLGSALPTIPREHGASIEPWGVQLANGNRCELAQGAHTVLTAQCWTTAARRGWRCCAVSTKDAPRGRHAAWSTYTVERRATARERYQATVIGRRFERAEAVEHAYVQAENATNGYMLNAAGRANAIDPRSLFTGPESRARRYASEELLERWQTHHRPTARFFAGKDTRVYEKYTTPKRKPRGVRCVGARSPPGAAGTSARSRSQS